MYFIGSAYAKHERSHISASVIDSLVGEGRTTAAVRALTRFNVIILGGYVAYATWGLFDFTTQTGTGSVELRGPMAWVYGSMLVGLVLMTVYFLLDFCDSVIVLLGSRSEAGGNSPCAQSSFWTSSSSWLSIGTAFFLAKQRQAVSGGVRFNLHR